MKPLESSQSSSVTGGASFSLGNRLYRTAWQLTWALFAAWTPPPLHAWRRFLLRLFGAKIGKGARIYGSARIWYPPNLEVGRYAILGWKVNCYNQGRIVLDDFANVAQYAHLVSGTHDIDDPGFQLITKPIRIGKHAWVASDAFVGPGVTMHEGSVLGGRAVTFKDLDPWTVYVGNPARAVRQRKPFADPDI